MVRKIRIFVVELILVGIFVAWFFGKAPDLIDKVIPWIVVAIFWHLTLEVVLERDGVKSRMVNAKERLGRMAWVAAFLVGGCLSLIYLATAKGIVYEVTTKPANSSEKGGASSSSPPPTQGPPSSPSSEPEPSIKPIPPAKTLANRDVPAHTGVLPTLGIAVESRNDKASTPKSTPSGASANWLAAIKTPPTISDVFQNDFPNTMKLTDDAIGIQWKDTGAVTHIKRQLYLDFPANSKFVGFYIPTSDPSDLSRTAEICLTLAKADAVQQTLDELPKKTFIAANLGQTTTIQDLTFSGRVVIYHDDFLSITQQADIIRAFAEKHYALGFFGPNDFGKTLSEWHRLHDDATRVQQ
jgi:hypothetical protein